MKTTTAARAAVSLILLLGFVTHASAAQDAPQPPPNLAEPVPAFISKIGSPEALIDAEEYARFVAALYAAFGTEYAKLKDVDAPPAEKAKLSTERALASLGIADRRGEIERFATLTLVHDDNLGARTLSVNLLALLGDISGTTLDALTSVVEDTKQPAELRLLIHGRRHAFRGPDGGGLSISKRGRVDLFEAYKAGLEEQTGGTKVRYQMEMFLLGEDIIPWSLPGKIADDTLATLIATFRDNDNATSPCG